MAYSAPAVTRDSRFSIAGLLSLFVTYVVWGSTYLAIRVAVREGAGWGPFWLGASRVLAAAAVLFAFIHCNDLHHVNERRVDEAPPSRDLRLVEAHVIVL